MKIDPPEMKSWLRPCLQSFVFAFNEQVQNIEMSKTSIVEVVSCLATMKARIQERQSDIL